MNDTTRVDQLRNTLQAVHESAVDSIVTIDERGTIETVNPATELMFGYPASELVGNNVKMLMPEPYHGEHDGYLQEYLQQGVRRIIGIGREVTARRKDGTEFPIHLAVSEVNLEGRRVFAGFVRDLTDLKQVQQHRATLGRIIEESLNEVFIFDARSLKFLRVNRGARENLGYSLEEMRELTPLDLKPEHDEAGFRKMIDPLVTGTRETVDFSTLHKRQDGSTYPVDVHLQAARYMGQPAIVAIILDISRRREAEDQVRKQQEQMQADLEREVQNRTTELRQAQAELVRSEKFSTLGKVAGGIAHEIRNPLNAVKTSAYFLLNARNPSLEKVREHLERIDRQVSLIDNVVTALSDVARLPDASLHPTAIEPLIRKIVQATCLPANITVQFDFPTQIPAVMVDENQMLIALKNLLRNARDAMPDGGTLTVAGETDANRVIVRVRDTGFGIPREDLDNVLEPLFTTKARGMGLGLPITRAIVEKNRGSLSLASVPGEGSEFRITLTTESSESSGASNRDGP